MLPDTLYSEPSDIIPLGDNGNYLSAIEFSVTESFDKLITFLFSTIAQ